MAKRTFDPDETEPKRTAPQQRLLWPPALREAIDDTQSWLNPRASHSVFMCNDVLDLVRQHVLTPTIFSSWFSLWDRGDSTDAFFIRSYAHSSWSKWSCPRRTIPVRWAPIRLFTVRNQCVMLHRTESFPNLWGDIIAESVAPDFTDDHSVVRYKEGARACSSGAGVPFDNFLCGQTESTNMLICCYPNREFDSVTIANSMPFCYVSRGPAEQVLGLSAKREFLFVCGYIMDFEAMRVTDDSPLLIAHGPNPGCSSASLLRVIDSREMMFVFGKDSVLYDVRAKQARSIAGRHFDLSYSIISSTELRSVLVAGSYGELWEYDRRSDCWTEIDSGESGNALGWKRLNSAAVHHWCSPADE